MSQKRDYSNAPQRVLDFYKEQHSKLNYELSLKNKTDFKKV